MSIETPTLAYKHMAKGWALPNALWGDTPAMREAGKDFLPQRTSESDDAYAVRLKETTLVNFFGSTIKNLTAKVFQKPVTIGANLEPTIDWYNDFDLCGSNINDFGMELFKTSLRQGLCHLLIDAPKSPGDEVISLAQQKDNGSRPYATLVTADQLIGWKTVKVNGVETLIEIRIHEDIVVDKADYEQEIHEQIRLIKLKLNDDGLPSGGGVFELYRKEGQKDFKPYDSGVLSLDYIPLHTLYTNRTGFMMGETYFTTLAQINHQHWQSSSYQRNILNVARVPRMMGVGFSAEEIKAFAKHGIRNGVWSTNENAKAQWIEVSGGSIEHGERDLEKMEEQMSLLSLDPVLKNAPTTEIATVANIEASKANSVLMQWAESFQRTMRQAIITMHDMSGKGDIDPELTVNDDFSVITDADKRSKEIRELHASGLITDKSALEEVRRIGLLDEDFDVDAEVALLSTELGLVA